MRDSIRGFVLSGAVVGVAAALLVHGAAEATQIYPPHLQWHLSVPVAGPAAPNTQVNVPLLQTTGLGVNPATGGFYEFTITDVTYDFSEMDFMSPDGFGHRVKVQVALLDDAVTVPNSTIIGPGNLFNTNAVGPPPPNGVQPNSNILAARLPNMPLVNGILLHSAGYWLSRDTVYDGVLASNTTGQVVRSNMLGVIGAIDDGDRFLEVHSEGVTTFSENFSTGLLIRYGNSLLANIRYACNNPANIPDSAMAPGTPPWIWIHLQGRVY